jgi:acid stress-induced BolA-like protein IbaG/YrbA
VRERFDDGTIHALSVKTSTPGPSASSASRPGADGSEKGSE